MLENENSPLNLGLVLELVSAKISLCDLCIRVELRFKRMDIFVFVHTCAHVEGTFMVLDECTVIINCIYTHQPL